MWAILRMLGHGGAEGGWCGHDVGRVWSLWGLGVVKMGDRRGHAVGLVWSCCGYSSCLVMMGVSYFVLLRQLVEHDDHMGSTHLNAAYLLLFADDETSLGNCTDW